MRLMEIVFVLAGAALCGYWAWWQTTRNMYYRSLHSTIRPPDVTEQDYDRWVIRRRKHWRTAKSALAAALGAAIAWVLFTMIDSGLTRR